MVLTAIKDSTDFSSQTVCAEEAYKIFLERLPVRNPKKLLFINPPQVPEDVFDPAIARRKGYYIFPPIGLLYLVAVAKKVFPSLDVEVVDLNFELLKRSYQEDFSYRSFWQQRINNVMRGEQHIYVGITCMFAATKPVFLQIANYIKEHFPEALLLTGGVQATFDAHELLMNNNCDLVFRKESELQFEHFLKGVVQDHSANAPQGISFKLDGRIYEIPALEQADVDWDIRPYYNLIDIRNYHRYGSLAAFSRYNGGEKPFSTVLSRRGCRARCTFCTVRNFNGFGVRQRTVRSVVDEIKFLVRELGIRHIDWLDDDLLYDEQTALTLFKTLYEEVPELEWICNNGLIAVAISDELMYWMVKSGMKAFKVGIESGNDRMLNKVKKPTTKPKLREKGKLFKKYPNVFVSGNFIVGFPGENFGEMLDTFHFANELAWDWASYYICQPLKGTEMFSAFQALGDERIDQEGYGMMHNPGRSAKRGEFGYHKAYHRDSEHPNVFTGRDIFKIDPESVPDREQIQEIWFTFNLITNFLENPNFESGGNPRKIVRWLKAIADAYPYDASMAAALAKGYTMLDMKGEAMHERTRFYGILEQSAYWQRRLKEFPELEELVNYAL